MWLTYLKESLWDIRTGVDITQSKDFMRDCVDIRKFRDIRTCVDIVKGWDV